ncbi:hypothetical protein J4212_06310 [Candidatus Woesearchaeota archaeon]|nr:hypothetical protein [Candidatus Woesearchaeota archaeon]
MYKPNIWDEDKWNIHSSGYGKHDSPSDKAGYHEGGHYSHEKDKDKYGANDLYSKNEKKDEDEKKKEDDEETIDDAVKEEDKKKEEEKKQQEEEDVFKLASKQLTPAMQLEGSKPEKKARKNKSIEEAISKAVKQEKETVILDH